MVEEEEADPTVYTPRRISTRRSNSFGSPNEVLGVSDSPTVACGFGVFMSSAITYPNINASYIYHELQQPIFVILAKIVEIEAMPYFGKVNELFSVSNMNYHGLWEMYDVMEFEYVIAELMTIPNSYCYAF